MTMADLRDIARDGWSALAEAYVDRLYQELDGKPFDRERLDAFARRIPAGATVLDAGCGPGHITAWLAARGVDARGVDLAPGMVAQAHKHAPTLRFDLGDLLDLP